MRDPWATLPANWRTRPIRRPPKTPTYDRPIPALKLPATTCNPHCSRCAGRENHGHCAVCVLVCTETPKPTKPADVCITRTRTPATLHTAVSGRQILVVHTCPYCQQPHIHSAHPGVGAYRRSGCGQPYILETTR